MNNTIKRIFLCLLVSVMLLGCFAGCAKNDEVDTTSPESTVSTAGTSPKEDVPIVIDPVAREAVVQTALAYLARGTRIQYDDRSMYVSAPANTKELYRWQSGVRLSPEEYTSQYIGYTNCSAFVGDVYLAALGVDLGTDTTGKLSAISDNRRIFSYKPTGKETADEMESIEAEFRANLEQGDIIVIRYNGSRAGNGHAMLYVGSEILENVEGYKGAAAEGTDENGNPNEADYVYDIIHSTGSSFNYNGRYEKFEQYGSVQITSSDSLFDSSNARHIFSQVQYVAIIRPLAQFTEEVPEHSLNRMEFMKRVIAEKLSSYEVTDTVNPGDEITWTFSVTNKNDEEITLPITDVVPANVTLVSAENCTVDGTSLNWTATIAPGKTKTVSYTVKVNEDVQSGAYICSKDGTVGKIAVNCPGVYVGRTLTGKEQKWIGTVAHTIKDEKARGLELANAVYAGALDVQNVLPTDWATLADGIFSLDKGYSYLAEDGTYLNLVPPGLFGGRLMIQRKTDNAAQLARYEDVRTRLLVQEQLTAGDVLIIDKDVQYKMQEMYLYTGKVLLDLSSAQLLTEEQSKTILTGCLADTRFVVLRPSLAMGNGK